MSIIMDGNFSAVHQQMKNATEDVRLADGHAFMVTDGPYKQHLATGKAFKQVRKLTELSDVLTHLPIACRNWSAMNTALCLLLHLNGHLWRPQG